MKLRATKQKREARVRGIGRDAELLGVGRQQLSLVLHGKRHSARLLKRYFELKAEQNKKAKA